MFGSGDVVTAEILRSATAPATTTTTNWAQQLAGIAIYDLVQSITSQSAAAAVIDRALQLNMDGIAELRVPGRVVSASAAAWVAEGAPVPVRSLSFSNAAILRPRKLAVISAFTREMVESSNVEATVRQTLGEAVALALDAQMFSSSAGDASKPPGLFAGITSLTATAGGGSLAMIGDIEQLIAALATNGAGLAPVFIAAAKQAAAMKTLVGPKFDYPIFASGALAAGTVAVVEPASLVSGFGSTAEFSTSKVAALHMEDASPQDITGGTPSPAVPVRSMFQTDAIALKSTLSASWGLRAAGHAQWIQNTTW
jgi:Phage capsid family